MALPDVTVSIQDGGTGVLPESVANAEVKIGVCSGGAVNSLYGFYDTGAAVATLGQGPLVEAVASRLKAAGGPVYAMPANPSQAGSVSAVTLSGQGPGTVAAALGPYQSVAVKIGTGGAQGVATYSVSIGGASYGGTYTTSATATPVPGTLMQVTFPTGTYVAGDVFTFATTGGAATKVGTGTVLPTGTFSPLDAYQAQVKITTAGALGAATFQYSLDNGNVWSSNILVPSAGTFAIPNSGVVLTFAGASFTLGDVYSFTTTPPGYTNTDLTNAFTALLGMSQSWGWVHVVGAPATSAASASVASVVDTQMQSAQTGYRFARALVECPNVETDATITAAFVNFASVLGRVGVGCGDANMVSPLTGRIVRRNPAWAAANRMGAVQPGEDLGYVGRGPLSQVQSLTRDEGATPALDAARFITLRSIVGKQGYYLTNGRLMAAQGSDFQYMQFGRVMDVATTVTRSAMLQFLNGSVRVDSATGYIDARDAKKIEMAINAQLNAAVVATGDASSAMVSVSRSQNIISTQTLPVTVRIVPLGYSKTITLNIGFMNPAISTT